MTKEQLIFTIINELIGQHPTQDSSKRAHPQEIQFEVEKAYNTIVKQFFMDPKNANNADLAYFSKNYTATLNEINNDTYFTGLPVQPMALPNGMGVRLITPVVSGVSSDVNIERITEGQWHNLKHLEAYCCGPMYAYVDLDGDKVIFKYNRAEAKMVEQVVLKIIPVFASLEDDDIINSPIGDAAITEMVLSLMERRPTDNTNDDER